MVSAMAIFLKKPLSFIFSYINIFIQCNIRKLSKFFLGQIHCKVISSMENVYRYITVAIILKAPAGTWYDCFAKEIQWLI